MAQETGGEGIGGLGEFFAPGSRGRDKGKKLS